MDVAPAQSVQQLHATLQRYAGWLDRERASVSVRADVQALGAAIESGSDTSSSLQSLETSIARLPSGELRKMLRAAAVQMRRALAA